MLDKHTLLWVFLIVIIIIVVIIAVGCITKKPTVLTPENFSFWSDVASFFSDWGKAFICKAAADCNNCGEEGTAPCPDCNDNPSDCFSEPGPPTSDNWCKYFYSTADPRYGQGCPDLLTQEGPKPQLSIPANTGWFCFNKQYVLRLQNGSLQCLSASNGASCLDVAGLMGGDCCASLLYAQGLVPDYHTINPGANATDAQIAQAFGKQVNSGWPMSAIRMGIWMIMDADQQDDSLVFQKEYRFLSDGSYIQYDVNDQGVLTSG